MFHIIWAAEIGSRGGIVFRGTPHAPEPIVPLAFQGGEPAAKRPRVAAPVFPFESNTRWAVPGPAMKEWQMQGRAAADGRLPRAQNIPRVRYGGVWGGGGGRPNPICL